MTTDAYHSKAGIYNSCMVRMLKRLRQDIKTYVAFKNYRSVIDVCCGTGDQLQLLDGPNMDLCGIDNSIAMLEIARESCSDTINLHLLDAEQESFDPGSFDCAIISFGLHEKHPTAAQTIFSNSRKLVRQGGSLVLTDFCQVPSSASGTMIGSFLVPIIERLAGKQHYQHYLNWLDQGGLEGFLDRQRLSCEIISKRFSGTVLCCAIEIDDERELKEKSYALLNRAMAAQTQLSRVTR